MRHLSRPGNAAVRYAVATILTLSLVLGNWTVASATATQSLSREERDRLCARALRDLEEAERELDATTARLEIARAQLETAAKKDEAQAEEVRLLRDMIAALEAQKGEQEKLVLALRDQVRILTEDNQRVRAERDRANKRNLTWAAIGAGVGAVLTYLFTRDDGPIVVVP
jgi:hypothetical protein